MWRLPKLTDAERAVISERMSEATRLLNIIEVSNAKREMDQVTDGHHVIAVRVEAPTVEQLAPIYDLLSNASKQFPANSVAEKAFRNQAQQFLRELGSLVFNIARKSTDLTTGAADFTVSNARARSCTVKYENGSIHFSGPFRSTTGEGPGAHRMITSSPSRDFVLSSQLPRSEGADGDSQSRTACAHCGRGILAWDSSQSVSRFFGRVHRIPSVRAGRRSAVSRLAARREDGSLIHQRAASGCACRVGACIV